MLSLEEGELWIGDGQNVEPPSVDIARMRMSIDSAMQNVALDLTLISKAGDEIAETVFGGWRTSCQRH